MKGLTRDQRIAIVRGLDQATQLDLYGYLGLGDQAKALLISHPLEELIQMEGAVLLQEFGPVVLPLLAAIELGRRMGRLPKTTLNPIRDSADALIWFQPMLATLPCEEVHALYVDRKLRPLKYATLTRGTPTMALFDERQILGPALLLNAYGLYVAHNHPSGLATPSMDDLTATNRLKRACGVLGVVLLDHLIVSRTGATSLREQGHLT